jgi:hypothetical protein
LQSPGTTRPPRSVCNGVEYNARAMRFSSGVEASAGSSGQRKSASPTRIVFGTALSASSRGGAEAEEQPAARNAASAAAGRARCS